MNPKYETIVKEEIDKLLDARFIYKIEHTEWISPIVIVTKKNGKIRVCVDLKNFTNRVVGGDLLKLLRQTPTICIRRSSLKNTQREMEAKTFSCWFLLLPPHTLQHTQSVDKIQLKEK